MSLRTSVIGVLRTPDGPHRLQEMLLRPERSRRVKGMGLEFRKMIITLLEFSFWSVGTSLGLGSITEYALSRKAKEDTARSLFDIAAHYGVIEPRDKPVELDVLFWRVSEAAMRDPAYANLMEAIAMLNLEHAYWACGVEAAWGVSLDEWLDACVLSCRVQLSIAARDRDLDLHSLDRNSVRDVIRRELLTSPRIHRNIRCHVTSPVKQYTLTVSPPQESSIVKRKAKAGDARLHFATVKHLSSRRWNNASSNSHMRSVLYNCGLAEAFEKVFAPSRAPCFTDHAIGTIGESMIVELEPELARAFMGLILHDARN